MLSLECILSANLGLALCAADFFAKFLDFNVGHILLSACLQFVLEPKDMSEISSLKARPF